MTIKRNNVLLFLMAALFITVTGFTHLPWDLNMVIAYLAFFALGIVMMATEKDRFFDVLPYNVGLKPVTALLIVALTFLTMPLANILSEIGSKFGGDLTGIFGNSVSQGSSTFMRQFFVTAIIPAVFEELFFRGFFYAGYKRARGARAAILLSAILFGLFHGNVQQILYAVVLGVIIAILREVTGSMWAGTLFHLVNNGYSVVMMFVSKGVDEQKLLNYLPASRCAFLETKTTGNLIHSIAVLVLFTALAVGVIILIAKREGRLADLKTFFKPTEEQKKGKVVTPCFVLAMLAFLIITVGMTLMLKYAPNMLKDAFSKYLT